MARDQIEILNVHITALGHQIAAKNYGFVVRELGRMLIEQPINLPAASDGDVLASVNNAFMPSFKEFALLQPIQLKVGGNLQELTSIQYLTRVNGVLKTLLIAKRYYCGQMTAADPRVRFSAAVKKELMGVLAEYVALSYERTLRQFGGGDQVRRVTQKINAALVPSGAEGYSWNAPTVPLNVELFGLGANVGQPISIGDVAPPRPGPPQQKEDFDLSDTSTLPNMDFAPVPKGAQSLGPTAQESTTQDDGAKKPNKNLWLWVGGALVAGYLIKSRK